MNRTALFHDAFEIEFKTFDKGGPDKRRFYKQQSTVADKRFDEHLASIATPKGKEERHGKQIR